jgi:crossover junction endodeoxyribonuclease RusA
VKTPREWTIRLPWPTPPLSLNDRGHWAARHRRVREVRRVAAALVRAQHIPRLDRCEVTLHYVPRDGRTRDTDNLVATLKPIADGIVDAGVVKDDSPAFMAKPEPVIEEPDPRDPHLYVIIRRTPGEKPTASRTRNLHPAVVEAVKANA